MPSSSEANTPLPGASADLDDDFLEEEIVELPREAQRKDPRFLAKVYLAKGSTFCDQQVECAVGGKIISIGIGAISGEAIYVAQWGDGDITHTNQVETDQLIDAASNGKAKKAKKTKKRK